LIIHAKFEHTIILNNGIDKRVKSKNKLIRITVVPLYLKILLKVQHQCMFNHYEVVGISSKGKELRQAQTEKGIRVIYIEMTRTIFPLIEVKPFYKLYKILRKEKPSVVSYTYPKGYYCRNVSC
jgi:hypothetical protein